MHDVREAPTDDRVQPTTAPAARTGAASAVQHSTTKVATGPHAAKHTRTLSSRCTMFDVRCPRAPDRRSGAANDRRAAHTEAASADQHSTAKVATARTHAAEPTLPTSAQHLTGALALPNSAVDVDPRRREPVIVCS